ncbi:MAG: hypothetical protein DMG78_12035 [Acidobacteria bacterium]|nr:MAG: hypothetical protein DMG78_12035 [Acidobacteriota bacterium]
MVILLIPEPVPSDVVGPQFTSARPIIEKVGVPVIDLLDTYAGSKNLLELRVSQDDVHANARGHEMVFENLYRKIEQDSKLSDFVFGTNQSKAARSGASQSLASSAAPIRPASP